MGTVLCLGEQVARMPLVNSGLNIRLACPFPTLSSSFLAYQGAYRSLARRYGSLQYGGQLEEDVKVWEGHW
jgi:hypothetical protein